MSLVLSCFGPREANVLRRANRYRDKSPLGKFLGSSCSAMRTVNSGDQSWQGTIQEDGQ